MAKTGHAALLVLAGLFGLAHGHGRLTQPVARNLNDNGAVAGGPGTVHSFGAGNEHTKYQHGICGNAPGTLQSYNRVGDIKATYVAGSTVEFKAVITAHHVGFFEFELCLDAGLLSESCFMMHRLLKEGCRCSCEADSTRSCEDCQRCRRWWKPLLQGELGQSVASGYAGPELEGQGNLVPYEYTMRYVIPEGIRTKRGVLRWHYMTTNSCTSKSSAPEEFWNCADVAISDSSGHTGGEVAFDNGHLEHLVVPNLVESMREGALTFVNAKCPEDESGNLLGVGAAEEYENLCGSVSGDSFMFCKNLMSGSTGVADCRNPPASGIICESECSKTWFQCANSVAYTKTVPAGTLCKDSAFVLEATCVASSGTSTSEPGSPTPSTTPSTMPSTTMGTISSSTSPESSTTPVEAVATCVPIGDCGIYDWCDQAKYVAFCAEGVASGECPAEYCRIQDASAATTTAAPSSTVAATTASTTSSPVAEASTTSTAAAATSAAHASCGECSGCLWSTGACHLDVDSAYCSAWSDNLWCGSGGGSSLAQRSTRRKRIRGHVLLQSGLALEQSGLASDEL